MTDRDAFVSAIETGVEGAARFSLPPAGQRFIAFNTGENFSKAWTTRLRQRLGLPPAEGQRTWEWVLEG